MVIGIIGSAQILLDESSRLVAKRPSGSPDQGHGILVLR